MGEERAGWAVLHHKLGHLHVPAQQRQAGWPGHGQYSFRKQPPLLAGEGLFAEGGGGQIG